MTNPDQRLPTPSKDPKRILLVDDNPDLAQSLKELLELEGHRVATVTDPLAALELARSSPPQICILDIELPIMDGYELAKRLRELPTTENAMFIAMTGYGHDHDPRRSREAGFAHHLAKPLDIARLTRIVDGAA